MGELLRRGHIAALAPPGAPHMDILIADRSGQNLFSLQVKTCLTKSGWPMSKKHESIIEDRLFYVFVNLCVPKNEAPEYFIMPSKTVAHAVKQSHSIWLRNPGLRGASRKDSDRRVIRKDNSSIFSGEPIQADLGPGWMDPYLGAWHYFDVNPILN